MQQVLVIHGGETFETYEDYWRYLENYELDFEKSQNKEKGWKNLLQENLGSDYQVILPQMPSPLNAKYTEWKLWLEKYIPFLQDNIIVIGHSLGGIFWTKYLSENTLPAKIKQLHLISAPFEDNIENQIGDIEIEKYSLGDFNLQPENLKNIEKQVENIFLYHSQNDPMVPFADLEKYAQFLPSAQKIIFTDKGHFITDNFPEILENVKK